MMGGWHLTKWGGGRLCGLEPGWNGPGQAEMALGRLKQLGRLKYWDDGVCPGEECFLKWPWAGDNGIGQVGMALGWLKWQWAGWNGLGHIEIAVGKFYFHFRLSNTRFCSNDLGRLKWQWAGWSDSGQAEMVQVVHRLKWQWAGWNGSGQAEMAVGRLIWQWAGWNGSGQAEMVWWWSYWRGGMLEPGWDHWMVQSRLNYLTIKFNVKHNAYMLGVFCQNVYTTVFNGVAQTLIYHHNIILLHWSVPCKAYWGSVGNSVILIFLKTQMATNGMTTNCRMIGFYDFLPQ